MRYLVMAMCACGGGGESPPDAPLGCIDDSAFEPNDTPLASFETPLAGSGRFDAVAAVCPEGDADLYSVQIEQAGTRVESTVIFESGVPLGLELIDLGGSILATGEPGGDRAVAVLVDAPVGVVIARVVEAGSGRGNYRLNISLLE